MTLEELLNKWGYSFSFIITTTITEYYQYEYTILAEDLGRIESFTKDVESFFNALINADIKGSLNSGILSPLKFRASIKDPLDYQVSKKISTALKNISKSGSFSVNVAIEQLFENEDLWKEYASVEREFEMLEGDEKEIKTISIEPKGGSFVGRNTVSYSYSYNSNTGLYDYKITTQTNILLNSIKRYLEYQTVTALGVLKKKGGTTVETIETPEIGNWKTEIGEDGSSTFIEIEKDEIIQEMKDLMDPQVGKEYHSYSIREVGSDIRVETTPFNKEPFDVKIEDIKLEV